jgi:Fic family protein
VPDQDPSRHYTASEERQLTEHLLAVTTKVHTGALLGAACSVDLLTLLHGSLFSDVRDHAGKIRRAGFGSDTLTFGPNVSPPKEVVPDRLLDLFAKLGPSLRSFDENPNAERYEAEAVHLAVWVHAELIRIHPFEDGNGRTARLMMNWLLVRLGLRPIAVEVVKEEYRDCLNHYFKAGDITPLVDLMVRLY